MAVVIASQQEKPDELPAPSAAEPPETIATEPPDTISKVGRAAIALLKLACQRQRRRRGGNHIAGGVRHSGTDRPHDRELVQG